MTASSLTWCKSCSVPSSQSDRHNWTAGWWTPARQRSGWAWPELGTATPGRWGMYRQWRSGSHRRDTKTAPCTGVWEPSNLVNVKNKNIKLQWVVKSTSSITTYVRRWNIFVMQLRTQQYHNVCRGIIIKKISFFITLQKPQLATPILIRLQEV